MVTLSAMGSICGTHTIPTIHVDKGEQSEKESKTSQRVKKYSRTSLDQVPAKPLRQWTPPQPTPMPKGIVLTPEPSQLTVDENNGARLSVSTHASGSDALSVSGSSMRSSTDYSSSLSNSTMTSKLTDKWKAPPRLEFLEADVRALLLGRLQGTGQLMPRPKVIHLKVIAPADECMKERLSLWEHALMPLRTQMAERGYVLDLQDDTWSSSTLSQNYFPPTTLYEMPVEGNGGGDGEGRASIWAVDALLIILTDTLDSRLPDSLNQDEYTLISDGIQEEDMAKLFGNLYFNENNREPALYNLQRRFMIKQNLREIQELILFMRTYFSKAHKDISVFCSNYHRQLTAVASQTSFLAKRAVAVSRSLTRVLNLDEETSYTCDMGGLEGQNGELHSHLGEVRGQVERNCHVDNVVQLELPLRGSKKRKNKFETDLTQRLQNQMSQEVRDRLDSILGALIDDREAGGRKVATGVPRSLVEELVSQSRFCSRLTDVVPLHTSATLTSLQDYVIGFSEAPLVVLAEAGWGLSTMAAQLVQFCVKRMPHACIAYRALGITPDSRSLMSSLASIQQQLDAILGCRHGNANVTSQEEDSPSLSKSLLREIVSRSTQNLPLVIILDGVALESSQLRQLEVMTLTCQLPCNTKLVVMTSDAGVARGLKSKMTNTLYVKAAPWEKQLIANLFSKTINEQNIWLSEAQNSLAANAIKRCPLPLFATIAGQIISDSAFAQLQLVEDELPGSVEEIANKLFDLLETHLPSDAFKAMMGHLSGSVAGIATWEMNDLLSVNDTVLLSIYSDEKNPPIHRAPSILWKCISFQLRQFLHVFVSESYYSFCWANSTVRRCAEARYLGCSTNRVFQHQEISDHFQGRWAGKKKPYSCPEEEIEQLEDRFIMPQPDSFGSYPNVRKLLCLPHHAMQSKSNGNFTLDTFILDISWIIRKMAFVSIIQVLLDLEEAKTINGSFTSEIKTMQASIYSSFNSLSVKSSEIVKILMKNLRSTKDGSKKEAKGLHSKSRGVSKNSKLYKSVEELDYLELSPLDEDLPCSIHLQGSLIPSPVINAIVPVDSKSTHLALLFKSEGEIQIVNCQRNVTVRTLTGLSHPATLKMVDATRAVVLCNRELCVVDLDQGKLLTKLRGVLNLRMPYFGLQNKDRVVVLSRDRMVVNVMDLANGSIVASFKAGETRFLDSLLLSRDGRVVVCGDETQKPFPLLVWSLEQNKLLHDIRMSQHEFLTHLAAITDDGLYLACGCKEINATDLNFVTVYDLSSGQLFRKFKMAAETTGLALCSANLSLVVALDTGQLAVWDVDAGTKRFSIGGVDAAIDSLALTANGQRCLSWCAKDFSISSHTVCLWDTEKGQLLGVHTFQSPVTSCFLSPEGSTIWVGVKACMTPVRLVLTEVNKQRASDKRAENSEPDAGRGLQQVAFGDASRERAIIQVVT